MVKKWYSWKETIKYAIDKGFCKYHWKGSHLVLVKNDHYIHIKYMKKIPRFIFKKIKNKIEKVE